MRKLLLSLVFAITAIAVQAQDPAVTMTTSLPNGSDVEFYLASLADNTTVQVDWGNGSLENFTIGQYNTAISGTTAGTTIKVYGTGITSLSAGYFNLTALNISKATSLTHLTVNNNQLQSLDIASNTNLQFIDCSNNQLEALSVTNNIKLEKIYCFKNKLTTIDITSNADLWELDCSNNLMTTLNFSSVTSDVVIDCSNNLLTSLILGKNMNSVRCKNNALTSLDISQNTSLYLLDCSNNQLSLLNLSNNGNLQYLICSYNKLSALNLSNNPSLTEVYCTNNKLTLATLPITQTYWNIYNYNPQAIYSLPKKSYETGELINLSSQLSVSGVNSVYTWKTKGGQTLSAGTHYTVTNGVFVFNSIPTDSVYCEITNTKLADITLTTNAILVTPPVPNVAMATTSTIGNSFSFSIGATANNTLIKVDWGNGVLANYTIGTSPSTISQTLTGNTVKIFGEGISFLNLENLKLTSLDIKGAPGLSFLNCSSNQLTSLDVSNNTLLRTLWCSWNKFTTLDVSKNTELDQLSCGMNQLSSLDVLNNTKITVLHCYANKLTTIDVSKNIILKTLLCDRNQLTNLDVSKNTELAELKCYSNKITALDLSKNIALTDLDCGSNPLVNIDLTKNTELVKVSCTFNNLTALNVTYNLKLVELYCQYNQLTSLDISKNTALKKLVCSTNKLSSLDISKNVLLTELSCDVNSFNSLDVSKNVLLTKLSCFENKLSSLDVSKNVNLTILNCAWNLLSIGTLPIKQPTWTTYTYSPQAKISLPKGEFAINEEIDLSGQLNSGSSTTTYTWKTQGGTTLVKDVDYTESYGKLKFIKQPWDYLYCEMRNANLPDLTLTTESISVIFSEPAVSFTTSMPINSQLSFVLKTNTDNRTVKVDLGNGVLTDYTVNEFYSVISGTLLGSNVKVYGYGITYVDISNDKINTIAVSSSALTYVDCKSNNLNFATLPLKQQNWATYSYSPQDKIVLAKTDYELNEEIDLSSQLTAGGNTTTYVWKTIGGVTLVKDVDYTENAGKFTFIKQPDDNFYCEMTSASFPDLMLTTEPISITTNPAVVFSTTLTKGTTFSFNITSSADNASIKVDWGDGTLSKYTVGKNYSTVSGTLTGNTVRIFGAGIKSLYLNDKKITTLDISGALMLNHIEFNNNPLKTIDLSKNTELQELECYNNQLATIDISKNKELVNFRCINNQLTSLDVSQNIKLQNLNCSSNKLTALDITKNINLNSLMCDWNRISTIDISNNTELLTLECSTNGLTTLDISKNTKLTTLDCCQNSLYTLDVSKNTELKDINCASNQLTSLDVSKNTKLTKLSCYQNKINALDISQNNKLEELRCFTNQLTSLDVTKNVHLTNFECYQNKITALDLSKNTALTKLICYRNSLNMLDLSSNVLLTNIECYSNNFSFITLPVKQQSWTTYTYSPQNKVKLAKKQYGLTETVDLSSELTVNANTTNYAWKTKGGATLTAGTDYNVNNGITTFLKVQTDSVYCQMTNATFPDLTLTTTNIKVSQFPLSVGNNEVAVRVFPNPTTDNFSIEMAEEIVRIEVYTLTGVKVFENGLYSSTKVTVPTDSMPKGTLIVRAFTRNGVYESRIVKI